MDSDSELGPELGTTLRGGVDGLYDGSEGSDDGGELWSVSE